MAHPRAVWAVAGANLIFIIVIVVLLVVLNDDPSITLIIGILSCAFLAISGILSAYLLRPPSASPMKASLTVNKVGKGATELAPYLHQEDDVTTVHVANMKQSRNSENAQMIPAETRPTESPTIATTREADKLESENKRLTQEIAKLERHNKLILDEYREFQQKHRGLAEDVLAVTNKCEQLDADNTALRQTIEQLSTQNEVETHRDALQAENESLQSQLDDLQTQMDETKTALDAYRQQQEQFGDYADMKRKCDALEQTLGEYEQRVNELDAKEQQLRDSQQQNRRLEQSIGELQTEISQYKSMPMPSSPHPSLPNSSLSMDGGAAAAVGVGQQEIRGQIQRLKQELAHAQKTIIEMTSVVSVNSVFPTVQEIIQQYRSIRDQRHHDTSTTLKQWIKTHGGGDKWQKFYVNQCCHEIMFDILGTCYQSMRRYRLHIYDAIAEQLNMTHAIADSMEFSAPEMARDAHKQKLVRKQQYQLLSNIFGAYFKNNFKQVLQRKLAAARPAPSDAASEEEKDAIGNGDADEDADDDDDDNDADVAPSASSGELVQAILAEIMQRPQYAAYALADMGDAQRASLNEYVVECCEVCWVMLLQDPPLQIVPAHWKCDVDASAMHEHDVWHDDEDDEDEPQPQMNGGGNADVENANKGKQFKLMADYNDDYHKRVLGSDRSCKKILYHVWPAVARKGVILGDQKIDVVLREDMYTPLKQKRNSVESIASAASNAAAV